MSNYKKLMQRRHREDEEAAYAFQEFIHTFQNTEPQGKTFIKSGVYHIGPATPSNDDLIDKRCVYAPMPLHKSLQNCDKATSKNAMECARILRFDSTSNAPKKSNLEQLKEEIQQRHLQNDHKSESSCLLRKATPHHESENCMDYTTNLFLTNLNPKLNEQELMQIFGVYGPLASVKIMWPRVSERGKNSNIGFVAFMSRVDSERAYYELGTRQDMRITWGKPIEIPHQPVYLPPELIKMLLPPPSSGLPFNAQYQHMRQDTRLDSRRDKKKQFIDLQYRAVKVTVPLDRKLLCLIHRTIEFLIREGPLFEAIIMHREIRNPTFSFLFDNTSSAHIYYRWKLFSILNGESPTCWSTRPFRMFEGGSIWLPPVIPDYTKGMQLKPVIEEETKQDLTDAEQEKLIHLIRGLTLQRTKISEAMIFCIGKMAAAKDITNIISESFEVDCGPKGIKYISRLYLISDILYNAKFKKGSQFEKCFQPKMADIFTAIDDALKCHISRQEQSLASSIRSKIMKVLRAWDMWRLFTNDFLEQLEAKIFKEQEQVDQPLDGKTLFVRGVETGLIDLPPIEMQEDIKIPCNKGRKRPKADDDPVYANFIKSKWETCDPAEVEAQAMSTQKLAEMELIRKFEEQLQKEKERKAARYAEKHLKYEQLRKIELKVIKYQDDLECGKRIFKYCSTIDDEVKEYRKRQIVKLTAKLHASRYTPSSSTSFSSSGSARKRFKR